LFLLGWGEGGEEGDVHEDAAPFLAEAVVVGGCAARGDGLGGCEAGLENGLGGAGRVGAGNEGGLRSGDGEEEGAWEERELHDCRWIKVERG
jgi:hypothetical protein